MNQYPNGHQFERKKLKASEIKFDDTYQRPVNQNKVNKAVKNFNGDIWNEPKVSHRPGEGYFCFDGRRSTAIWQALHDNPDVLIDCKIFCGMSWDDEVEAFIQQFGENEDVTQAHKLRARYNRKSDKDIDVIDMVDIVGGLGWTVDFDKEDKSQGDKISAVVSLYRAYTTLGRRAFIDMMETIRESWGSNKDAVTNQILTGMKDFYKAYYGSFKHIDLVSSMKQTLPSEIIRHGKARKDLQTHTYGTEIWKQYNKGRRTHKLPEKL